MVACDICGCNYDHGELTGGVCGDCREREKQRKIQADAVRRMLYAPCYHQMKLELEGVS